MRLLREKIVAAASRRMVVIADESKIVTTLGRFPLPIEVNPFGLAATHLAVEKAATLLGLDGADRIADDGRKSRLSRTAGISFSTHLLAAFPIQERCLSAFIAIPGVVEHGLFMGMATAVVVAGADGVTILRADDARTVKQEFFDMIIGNRLKPFRRVSADPPACRPRRLARFAGLRAGDRRIAPEGGARRDRGDPGDRSLDGILPASASALKQALIAEEPRSAGTDHRRRSTRRRSSWRGRRADLEKEAAIAYAEVFTEEELNAIAAFYNSDTGKKLLSDRPDRDARR